MKIITAVHALVDASVDFTIIGGWAALLHGAASATNNLDVCYSRQPENLKRLAGAFAPFHPRLRGLPGDLLFVWDAATLHNGTNFKLWTDFGAIDLLAEADGLGGFEEVKASSILVHVFDRDVWTLDLPSLIRAKRAAGREKDLRALPELEGLLEAQEAE
jgi:hypothetical protein